MLRDGAVQKFGEREEVLSEIVPRAGLRPLDPRPRTLPGAAGDARTGTT